MKHVVTDLDNSNETITLGDSFSIDLFFENFIVEISPITNAQQQSGPSSVNKLVTKNHKLLDIASFEDFSKDGLRFLYFDGSKSKECVGVGCLLLDPKGNGIFVSYRLEFECTNNTIEYEALIQGLMKVIDLGIQRIKVFDDSEIIVKKVQNAIHFVSAHLQNYQTEVCDIK